MSTLYARDFYARMAQSLMSQGLGRDGQSALYLTILTVTAEKMMGGLPATIVLGFYEVLAESNHEPTKKRARHILQVASHVFPELRSAPGPYPLDSGAVLFITAARGMLFGMAEQRLPVRATMTLVIDNLLSDASHLMIGDSGEGVPSSHPRLKLSVESDEGVSP